MVAENLKRNLSDRGRSVKALTNEPRIVKGIVGDIRNFAHGDQATLPKQANLPGRKGSILETIPAAGMLAFDKVSTLVQENIKITRRWA